MGNQIREKSFFGETSRYQRELEGRSEERSYNALNHPKSITDGEGNTTILETDLWGRPEKIHLPDGGEETYRYAHEKLVKKVVI